MELSAIIPTRDRIDSLRQVLVALTAQTLPTDRFQIIVSVDGPGDAERALVAGFPRCRAVRVIDGPPDGPGAARNRALPAAQAPIVLFLNDDTVPDADLVARHIAAHADPSARGAMILGSAPWRTTAPDRVVDRLVRETSMIFFFDQMTDARARNPHHDWGFRHAWTLNLSVGVDPIRRAGGFSTRLRHPVYEDVELGYRLATSEGMRVLYRPRCRVTHDHRYSVESLARREVMLGHQAVALAEAHPDCARAIFGFLHTDRDRVRGAREAAATGAFEAGDAMASFADIAEHPAESVSASCLEDVFEGLWKPVRTHLRTLGWIAAVDGLSAREAMDQTARWTPMRGLTHAA